MRSGAVTNRTYRAWGKIKLPKYLFKLHKVCGTSRSYRKGVGNRSSLLQKRGRESEFPPTEKGSGIGVFLLGRFPPPTGELNASVYTVKSLAPKR